MGRGLSLHGFFFINSSYILHMQHQNDRRAKKKCHQHQVCYYLHEIILLFKLPTSRTV